jgi:hypothetical protein
MAIQVFQDRKAVAIELARPEQSPIQLMLGLDELDRLIHELGDARSQMVVGQPYPDFESDSVSICVAAGARWYLKATPPKEALFASYHPKFGPVGLTLPAEQIAGIVRFLTERFILQPTRSAETH